MPQVGAHRVRLLAPSGNLAHALPPVDLRPIADESPHVSIERPELLLDREERVRIPNRRGNLEPVPDDARIAEELRDLAGAIESDFRRVEPVERGPVGLSFPQDRQPGEACLSPFEDEKLEELAIVVLRDAPLLIVIARHERVDGGPGASSSAIGRLTSCGHVARYPPPYITNRKEVGPSSRLE